MFGLHGVQEFSFLDGTTLSYEQLLARGFDIHATGNISEDYVEGTNIQDRIYGSWQAETLVGLQGDDSLFGARRERHAAGHGGQRLPRTAAQATTSLFGGVGSDTYYFDRLSGNDRVLELVELADDHGDVDTIVFGADILPEDLVVSLDSLGPAAHHASTARRRRSCSTSGSTPRSRRASSASSSRTARC